MSDETTTTTTTEIHYTSESNMEQFAENALAPRRVRTDSGEVEQHSLSDQMKALDYIKKQEAINRKGCQLGRLGVYQVVNLED